MAGQAMAASFFSADLLLMLVLHVCVLVPTLSGVTTIWEGREVASPLFDREISDRMANYSIQAVMESGGVHLV